MRFFVNQNRALLQMSDLVLSCHIKRRLKDIASLGHDPVIVIPRENIATLP